MFPLSISEGPVFYVRVSRTSSGDDNCIKSSHIYSHNKQESRFARSHKSTAAAAEEAADKTDRSASHRQPPPHTHTVNSGSSRSRRQRLLLRLNPHSREAQKYSIVEKAFESSLEPSIRDRGVYPSNSATLYSASAARSDSIDGIFLK